MRMPLMMQRLCRHAPLRSPSLTLYRSLSLREYPNPIKHFEIANEIIEKIAKSNFGRATVSLLVPVASPAQHAQSSPGMTCSLFVHETGCPKGNCDNIRTCYYDLSAMT